MFCMQSVRQRTLDFLRGSPSLAKGRCVGGSRRRKLSGQRHGGGTVQRPSSVWGCLIAVAQNAQRQVWQRWAFAEAVRSALDSETHRGSCLGLWSFVVRQRLWRLIKDEDIQRTIQGARRWSQGDQSILGWLVEEIQARRKLGDCSKEEADQWNLATDKT